MSLRIRPASPGDDDILWQMLEPVFRKGESFCRATDVDRAGGLDYWQRGHDVFIAEEDGRVVGSYYIGPNQQGGGAHVCNCGYLTAQDAQGRGIARRLLEASLEEARSRGYRAMQFNFVIATNTRAVATWSAYGFETVGRLPGAYRRPGGEFVDALVMYKTL
ncbi:GNAT family N-acetyltransferase [Halovulum dunhuangense]|uniref:GNAT family N-acetyltransferase n=1 Tax=Halovulum dunhuangense TaxID=1505036 RepID=A0A849L535_9RHOB|nr:N-acetyltransferase [Halovulum dunhuangense]NNU81294.1 GNAT family N-acetyltransferase [Halovulum dunhuangense]